MAEKKMKGCLQLNQHLMQALSHHAIDSLTKRDQVLLLIEAKLLDMLKEFLKESNAQQLYDLQTELSKIVAPDQIDMEEVFRFHQLVAKAMRNNLKRETLIQVNLQISQAMFDGAQEVVREKLLAVLRILSQGMIDCTGNKDVESLFRLNEALAQVMAEKSEEKKLELLTSTNVLLAQFMAAGYTDTSTEWLMELNRLSALALAGKNWNPTFLQKSIYVLSRELRKSSAEAVLKDSMKLIFTLSSMLMEGDLGLSLFNELVTWKIQLSNIMQELLGESSKDVMKKAEGEDILALTAALQAENRQLRDEIDALTKSRDASQDEVRKLKVGEAVLSQELLKSNEKKAELKAATSEKEVQVPQEAEIAEAGRQVDEDEAKSEAHEKEKGTAVATTSSPSTTQNVGGERNGGAGSGTGSGEATTARFPIRNKARVKLYGKRDPMHEVYLPPVTQHNKGNRGASPRGSGPRNPRQETP